MAMILILNGSPRKNGKTASLINAFTEGAESFWKRGMIDAVCLLKMFLISV